MSCPTSGSTYRPTRLFKLQALLLGLLLAGCAAAPAASLPATAEPTSTSSLSAPSATQVPNAQATAVAMEPTAAASTEPSSIARWGNGTPRAAAFAPGGGSVALATSLGIWFYDTNDFAETHAFSTRDGAYQIAFSPDGSIIAARSHDNVDLLDAESGELLIWFDTPTGRLNDIVFSPDATLIATTESTSASATAKIWRVDGGTLLHTLDGHTAVPGYISDVNSVDFSSDGALLASGGNDGVAIIWDVASGAMLRRIEAHKQPIDHLAFVPGRATLVTTGSHQPIALWDVESGARIAEFGDHDEVRALAVSPDGTLIATGGFADRTVVLWDATDGSELWRLTDLIGPIQDLQFSPDGRQLLVIGTDGIPSLWSVAEKGPAKTPFDPAPQIVSLIINPDESLAVIGEEYGTVALRQVPGGELVERIIIPDSRIAAQTQVPPGGFAPTRLTDIAAGASGELLAVSMSDGTVRLLSLLDGRAIRTIEIGEFWERTEQVLLTPDERVLFTADSLGIRQWDIVSGSLVRTLPESMEELQRVTMSADGSLLAGGFSDGSIKAWLVANGTSLGQLSGAHTGEIVDLQFSSDGATLVSHDEYNVAAIWNVSDGSLRSSLSTLRGSRRIALSPDGSILAVSGTIDGLITLYSTVTAQPVHTLEGHANTAGKLIFSADGKQLYSTSDGLVIVWELQHQ